MKTFRPILLMLLAAFLLAACSVSLAEDITPPPDAQAPISAPQGESVSSPMTGSSSTVVYPVVAPDPAKGAVIFAEKCAPCHGDAGLGDGPRAAQLSVPVAAIGDPAKARQATPASWFNMVTNGNIERFMPPFVNGLDDRQRWDVVAYAFTLSQTPGMLATGKELYTADCAECHGDTGLGDGPKAGSAAPRSFHDLEFMASQTDQALFDAITNGVGDKMQAYAQLSEDERWALVAYVRDLTYAASGATTSGSASAAQPTPATEVITATSSVTGTGSVKVSITLPDGMTMPEKPQVILYAFDNMSLAFTTTQATQDGVVFTFENVGMPSDRAFIASFDYNGVTYGSDVAVPDSTGVIELDVPVFETSTDTSALVIDRLHMFFDFSVPEVVQVVEVYVFNNPTGKTIASAESGGPVATFMVPENAQNLQFQDGAIGGKYLSMPGGFADTTPVRAGETGYQVMFAYDLPYKDGVKFDQVVNYPVNSSIILIPDNGVKLKSDILKEGTAQAIQGANYNVYNSEAIQAGAKMTLELSGKASDTAASAAAAGTGSDQNSLLIGLGALGLVLILAGVYMWRRERLNAAAAEEEDLDEEEETEDDLDDADSLMDAIIALDDQYKSGQIAEEAYQQRRAELKSRLQKHLG